MGGGTSVRTSFKGKASFEDIVSRYTLYIGMSFMIMMIILVVLGNYMLKHGLLK